MTRIDLADVSLPTTATVREAIEKVDRNCLGVVFITDDDRLVGAVTDGDFRRSVLRGEGQLEALVTTIMNPSPSTLSVGAGAEETFSALAEGVSRGRKVFPRVDQDGRIREVSFREHWGLLPVAEPDLTGAEAANVLKCIEENWISSSGEFIPQFESGFSAFTGLSNPIAVSNGTVALTLAMQAIGLRDGDEVIVPSLTFAATANAVVAAGGTPVLADVDPITWGLSPATTEPLITNRTRGIIPVHLYGSPCDTAGLSTLAASHGLFMLEDCAEAIGSRHVGAHVGALGDSATFSFFGNKTLTTGEGGMVFFRDADAAQRARQLRDHGMSRVRRYWHEVVGYNYRMTNIQAALGVAQVDRAHDLVARKQRIGLAYLESLSYIRGVSPMPTSPFGESSYWLFALTLAHEHSEKRDALMEYLAYQGVQSRITFPPLHSMPAFSDFPRANTLPVTERIASTGICLPNTPRMTTETATSVVVKLGEGLTQLGIRASE
jgi:perosamine synthetase